MVKLILDTNTLVSAALNEYSISGKAFDKANNSGNLLASQATLTELKEVLFRAKFDKYTSITSRKRFYDDYLKLTLILPVDLRITDCRDPKDNKFLELAVAGKADVIVTGDKDLLVLHPYRGIVIMNSAGFLEWSRDK